MEDGKSTPGNRWETRLREATAQMEDDLRRLVAYVNDEVVPEVRRNGSAALRTAATELGKLAQRMEESNRGVPPPPAPAAAAPPAAAPAPTPDQGASRP